MIDFKVLAVAACFIGTAAIGQSTINVSIEDARAIATRALFSGDPSSALEIAQTILAQFPDDRAALMVVAAAAPQLGDPTTGRQAGARAWAVSQTDLQKYEAARLTALAAANEERFTLSTFWLRRALTVVPNDAERERTLQDARAVTRRNPWSTQLSFSLVPSTNVNGGAEDADCGNLGALTCTLSEDSLALSGWRATLNVGTSYRFQESQRSRTSVGLRYEASRVRITEETRVPDESLRNSLAEYNLRHERVLENGIVSLRYSFGRYDYRHLDPAAGTTTGESYDTWRLGIDRRLALNDRTVLSLSAQRDWLTYSRSGIGEVDRISLSTGLSYQLDSGDQVGGGFTQTDSQGDSPSYTLTDKSIWISYAWSEPIGPIALAIGGGLRWSDYPVFVTTPNGRQDTTVFANMTMGFPQVEYAGFTPGLRIDASQSDSNVSRFDRTSFSVGLTINSSF